MTVNPHAQQLTQGSAQEPHHYEEQGIDRGDVRLHGRYFTLRTAAGLVAGTNFNVMFAIERPVKDVWRSFKDFNLWQENHVYSGVLGDLEGKTFSLSLKNYPNVRLDYEVMRVIPEYLIVLHQPLPEGAVQGLPGLGGVSPGFHVFMLSEHGGKTIVTGLMNHASLMEKASAARGMSDEDAIHPWRESLKEGLRKWQDDFIPALKKLVEAAR
jgi:hypothetical protein